MLNVYSKSKEGNMKLSKNFSVKECPCEFATLEELNK